jgi:hypothetical protein
LRCVALTARPALQLVGTIIAKVFVAHGQPNPVLPMRDGDEAAVRLHNWNALVPHLHTFGIDFAPDVKALVVAGGAACGCALRSGRLSESSLRHTADHAALIKQLHEMRVRCGTCSAARSSRYAQRGAGAGLRIPHSALTQLLPPRRAGHGRWR